MTDRENDSGESAEKQRGWVSTAKEFADVGRPTAVDHALSRRQRGGTIRIPTPGICEFPRLTALATASSDGESNALVSLF
jgi:hypothetical protein